MNAPSPGESCCIEDAILRALRTLQCTPVKPENHFLTVRTTGDCLPYLILNVRTQAGLASVPGRVGDGAKVTAASGTETYRGAKATPETVRRFLVGPVQCEITGIAITPDGKTMFCNVQHPGEDGTIAAPTSHWPDSQTNPASTKRPRSATMVITRTDGGEIGV